MVNLPFGLGGINIPMPTRNTGSGSQGFAKVLTLADTITTTSGVAVTVAGGFQKVGTYTVPAQQKLHFGFGSAVNPQNQGYLYIQLKARGTNADTNGTIRLVQANAQETVRLVVFEERTEELDGDQNDKNKKIPLPEQTQFPLVGENSKMIIEFKPDAAVTVSELTSEATVRIPVTVYQ